jgi:membrane-bound metal-dependent hydrolase YbcI (DUF457 family)
MIHTLIVLFILLCVVGLILWGIQQIPGIPPIIKTVVIVVVGCLILLWLLNSMGGMNLSLR